MGTTTNKGVPQKIKGHGYGQITRQQPDNAVIIWHLAEQRAYFLDRSQCKGLPIGALIEFVYEEEERKFQTIKRIEKTELPPNIEPLLPVPRSTSGSPPPSGGPPKPKPRLSSAAKNQKSKTTKQNLRRQKLA